LFDGDVIDGPVPVLFALHPDEAAQALAANPDKAFKDLQRIFAKFYIPENIPASAAMAQVTNPKAPEVAFPYRRKEYVPEPEPPTKRARTSAPSPTPGPSTAPETTTGRIMQNAYLSPMAPSLGSYSIILKNITPPPATFKTVYGSVRGVPIYF
jgi:hypothetical protein